MNIISFFYDFFNSFCLFLSEKAENFSSNSLSSYLIFSVSERLHTCSVNTVEYGMEFHFHR